MILAAYRGALADFNAVETQSPVDGNSPILADHMADNKLQTVISSLLKLGMANEVATGSLTSLRAQVTQFDGSEAVVVSCELDTTAVLDATNHQIVVPASNTTELVNEELQLTDGAWKVTYGSQVSPGCS